MDKKTARLSSLRMKGLDPLLARHYFLRVVSGPDLGKKCFLTPSRLRFRIGTSQENDFILADPGISRAHAEILQTANGFLLRDMGSTNGTLINEVRIHEAYLQPAARIRMGTSELELVFEKKQTDANFGESRFGELLGQSKPMQQVFEMLEKAADTPLSVLLTGETGTGKELAARGIHQAGSRRSKPFVVVDCGAIPENLMESELFGHERGAFTGATAPHTGAFESANGGTVFLDEIGELDLQLQPKLLRVLERLEIRRIGSNKTLKVDVRVIAATNRDVKEDIRAGRFRKDLYYRISAIEILIPPLRDHREDIPLLLEHLCRQSAGTRKAKFSENAVRILTDYHWPGNIRQLRNIVERALVFARNDVIEPKDLMTLIPQSGRIQAPLARSLVEMEKAAIQRTLELCGGNKTASAKSLGISYSTLFEKMKRYGILRKDE